MENTKIATKLCAAVSANVPVKIFTVLIMPAM